MPTSIEIRELTKAFPGAGMPAVDQVSLSIAPGELFFLLGPSGCGKSTLLRMIAGFTEPTSGQILFDGQDVARLPANERDTGMVFQSYALWPHMSVADNVGFGLDVRKVSGAERSRRIDEALAGVQMQDYAKRKPNQLSGGQQQRVALARAMVIRPRVLLLDEPLSNLDAKLRLELRADIRRLCKASGMTAIYVTHDQKEALSMADRIAVLRAGRVEQCAAPREMYERPRSRFVAEFIGETNILPARVARRTDPGCELELAGGLVASSHSPPEGSKDVLVSIRPEAVRLMPLGADAIGNAATARALNGVVHEATYLGESVQYTLSLGSNTASLRATVQPEPGHADPSPGDRVRLSIHPSAVLIYPAR